MKKIKETDKGFYGCYWPYEGSECGVIAMSPSDFVMEGFHRGKRGVYPIHPNLKPHKVIQCYYTV